MNNIHAVNMKTKSKVSDLEEFRKALLADERWEKEKKTVWYELKLKLYYPVYRFFRRITEFPDDIIAFWQRGRRGYADRDAWAIDFYLDSFMPDLLRTMVDRKKGGGWTYPGDAKDPRADTFKHWKKTVQAMAKGFEASRAMDDIEYKSVRDHRKKWKALDKKRKQGMELFVKYYHHLWD
jgi:hypothetical protein